MRFRLVTLPLALFLTAGAMASGPDPIRERIVADAGSVSPAALAFDRTTHVVQIGGGTRSEEVRIDRWDGRAWSLVSINGKPPTAAAIKAQTRASRGQPVPGYHRLAGLLTAATESRVDAQGRTILGVPKLPPRTIVNDGTDISSHLKAEAVIATASNGQPWVQQLRLSAREPFKMSWVLKVLSFDQVSEYRLDTSGKPRLASQNADSQGTMFGISGGQKSEVTYAYR